MDNVWSLLLLCWTLLMSSVLMKNDDLTRTLLSHQLLDISLPKQYVLLSGDLEATYRIVNWKQDEKVFEEYTVEASLVDDNNNETATSIGFEATLLSGKVLFRCGSIFLAGRFYLQLVINTRNYTLTNRTSEYVTISWPVVRLGAPTQLETYTAEVTVTLESAGIACHPRKPVKTAWIELVYYGRQQEDDTVSEPSRQVIQDIPYFYRVPSHDVTLHCASFDQAGTYRIQFRTNRSPHGLVAESNLIRVSWSDEYKIQVESPSVLPCPDDGFVVLYEHPDCILPKDRIRVYGRRKLAPAAASPSVFHYVSEKRVDKGHQMALFSCHFFNNTYVEYCFKYISVARRGAVTEVRTTCVPTYASGAEIPVDGGWGEWSSWSSCSTTCGHGGTRIRHRLCDNPTPSNNGMFCMGEAIEDSSCHWTACPDDVTTQSPVDMVKMTKECRCGCKLNITHGGAVYIASSAKHCSRISTWIFSKGVTGASLRFTFLHFELNDTAECLQVRDGDQPSSELLLHETGNRIPPPIVSSSDVVLLRFHPTPTHHDSSGSGFIVKVETTHPNFTVIPLTVDIIQEYKILSSPVHLAAMLFCMVLTLVSLAMVIHHYVLHKRRQSEAILSSPLGSSPGSLDEEGLQPFQPVTSTTSLSDVSLHERQSVKLRQYKKRKMRHLPIDSIDSLDTSHLTDAGAKSPEDYLRDSRIFDSSPSSSVASSSSLTAAAHNHLNYSTEDVVKLHPIINHKPPLPLSSNGAPPPPQNARSVSSSTTTSSSQPPLKQSPLTPVMSRKLPVATVSPQPARILSNKPTDRSIKELGSTTSDMQMLSKIVEVDLPEIDDQSGKSSHRNDLASTTSSSATSSSSKVRKVCPKADVDHNVPPTSQKRSSARSSRRTSDKQGRTRMPTSTSEVSLADAELEYDYYDYGVHNTPGSYFSHVTNWLPPFLPEPPPSTYPLHHFGHVADVDNDSLSGQMQESSADSDTLTASAISDISNVSLPQPITETVILAKDSSSSPVRHTSPPNTETNNDLSK